MSTINGIGTMYLGNSDIGPDGSYVATQWVCFIFPIVPIRSLRVLPTSHLNLGFFSRSTFDAQRVPLHWPHVAGMYAAYLVAALFLLAIKYLTGAPANHNALLSSAVVFAISVFFVRVSGFIRGIGTIANLIVLATIILFSLIAASNMSAQPATSWKLMYFLWAGYAFYALMSSLRRKAATKASRR